LEALDKELHEMKLKITATGFISCGVKRRIATEAIDAISQRLTVGVGKR
jgi:hypothetical protein